MKNEYTQEEVRVIFNAACDLDIDKQHDFVLDAAAENTALYNEVISLLGYDSPTQFESELVSANTMTDSVEDIQPNSIIGPYTIKSLLGQGGCGVVYHAHQTKPLNRDVALKVIKPGMNTGSVLQRFEFERKSLERMDHPNISRVLDSGLVPANEQTPQRPFFVMELVQGIPITDYAKKAELDIRSRVELVAQVCAAVQHAHNKGVLHRDIKPSNILVTLIDNKPVCKVIDFGIAKALDNSGESTMQMTHAGALIGTPQYMSPEQMSSSTDIDTRCDIYSIGVVLYELLTGHSPYESIDESKGIITILKQIESETINTPSSRSLTSVSNGTSTAQKTRAHTRIPRELDWITLQCIHKDPDNRYQTVAALQDDLERSLRNEPVVAGPPTVQYKISKFVSRNRGSVLAASLAVVALITSVVISTAFGIQTKNALSLEQEQRKIANRNIQRVESINEFLLDDLFLSVDSSELGPNATLAQLLDQTAPTVNERFLGDGDMRVRLHYLLGEMYSSISQFTKAITHVTYAIENFDQTYDWTESNKANLYKNRGRDYLNNGELDNAIADFLKSKIIYESIDPVPDFEYQVVLTGLATTYQAQGDIERAEPMLNASIEHALKTDPIDLEWLTKTVSSRLAMLGSLRRFEETVQQAEWIIDFCEQSPDASSYNLDYLTFAARVYRSNSLAHLGRTEEAVDSISNLILTGERVFGANSPSMIGILHTAGTVMGKIDRVEESIDYRKQTLVTTINVYGPHHYETERQTNNLAFYAQRVGYEELFRSTRTRGLLLRLYVAGPGENESLHGITPIGIELTGSYESWKQTITEEFENIPIGHNKRARFLANAAISFGADLQKSDIYNADDTKDQIKQWLIDAVEALPTAERPSEVQRILQEVFPDYLLKIGDTEEARKYTLLLSNYPSSVEIQEQ